MTTAKPTPPRLPLVETPDDPLGREQFAKLAAGRGILNLHRMMAHAPELMKASGDMAVAFRHEAILARALAEIVILRTAQVVNCDYEWERHVPIAGAAGVSEQQIAEVGRWPQSTLFNPKEKIALKYAEILAGGARVDDQTFAELQRHLPAREIVALTMLVGFYVSTAIFIKALAIPDDNA
jgi:4-carboxymuconolactone decarboxylase